ncbi:SGNH hydrolase [Dipodascopsis uninucleata]
MTVDMMLDKIILFGDSITRRSFNQEFGFNLAPALQNDYSNKLDVVVRGFGGYTTEMAKLFFESIIETETHNGGKIRLMVIFFGTNDAAESLGVSAERYAFNLKEIVNRAQSEDIRVIIVGPTLHQRSGSNDDRSSERNMQYSRTAQALSQSLGVPFVDLWTKFADHIGYDRSENIYPGEIGSSHSNLTALFVDGIHFTGLAYKLLYEELKRTIRAEYPELDSDTIPYMYPPIEEVDPLRPVETITAWKRPVYEFNRKREVS